MRSVLTSTTESITAVVFSPGAPTPVYIRVGIHQDTSNTLTTTVTGTFTLFAKNAYADDSEYATVTTYTAFTQPDAILQVVGQLKYKLQLTTVSAGGAVCELVPSL